MKVEYSFAVLRYVHDIVTEEFINIGIVLYAPKANYLNSAFTTHYRRLSEVFSHQIEGDHYRSLVRYLSKRFSEQAARISSEFSFSDLPTNVLEIANSVLPQDDSSFQWSESKSGVTKDLDKTLEYLFTRLVLRYESIKKPASRGDDDIKGIFKKEFEAQKIIPYLRPKHVTAPNYDYNFEYAWKNGAWNLYEPISFDLVDSGSILEKANKWVGRGTSLNRAKENLKLYLLVGQPSTEKNEEAFRNAEKILKQIPLKHEIVNEKEAEEFSKDLAKEIKKQEKA